MKTFKEFETLVNVSSKQELFKATEETSTGKYNYAIDFYDNKVSDANYFVMYSKNGKLQEWHCVTDYAYAMEVMIGWLSYR